MRIYKMCLKPAKQTLMAIAIPIMLSACAATHVQERQADYNATQALSHSYCYQALYGDQLVSPDYTKAKRWCARAAQAGVAPSQVLLAEMYLYGIDMEQDVVWAFTWYGAAAEQNHPHAQYVLSQLYFQGVGVEFDAQKAEEWLQKAANNGYEPAQKTLDDAQKTLTKPHNES